MDMDNYVKNKEEEFEFNLIDFKEVNHAIKALDVCIFKIYDEIDFANCESYEKTEVDPGLMIRLLSLKKFLEGISDEDDCL